MSRSLFQRLRDEAEIIERFASAYGRKFERLIDRLNRTDTDSDLQCIRLCVEAVNMMVTSQTHIAHAIKQIADEPAEQQKQAA